MGSKIKVSVIVLTNNSHGVVNRLVDKILPELDVKTTELIFLDNNSTDGTPAYLAEIPYPNKTIHTVPKGTFSHSRTRMWGAGLARGDVVVFFTDDVIPVKPRFIPKLISPVMKGVAVATYGVSQIDPHTGDPLRASRYNDWSFHRPNYMAPISAELWRELSPMRRRVLCNFDNCAACYDREILLDVGFPDLPYGEDMGIAKNFLLNNYAIMMVSDAKFYHWHHVSYSYFVKRMCVDQIVTKMLFDFKWVKSKFGLVKMLFMQSAFYTLYGAFHKNISFSRKIYWIFYSYKYIFAENVGRYIGSLDEEKHSSYSFIDRYLLKFKKKYYEEVCSISILRNK